MEESEIKWLHEITYYFSQKECPFKKECAILDALCHTPRILKNGSVMIYSLGQDHIIHKSGIFQESLYHEERSVCRFLLSTYTKKDGMMELSEDVEFLFQFNICHSCVTPLLRYLYKNLVTNRRVSDYFHLITDMPLPAFCLSSVSLFATSLIHLTRRERSDYIVECLTKKMVVDSESDWKKITEWRTQMACKWAKKSPLISTTIKFGAHTWECEWHVTSIAYQKRTYYEKWEDRIIWFSRAFGEIYSKESINDIPECLILLLAPLL